MGKSVGKPRPGARQLPNRGFVVVFQGASSLSLDAKGRLSVPTRHRDVLLATAQGQLTITKHPHGCLMVFPRPEWEKFRDRIAQLPM